jgi:hypothetical protein
MHSRAYVVSVVALIMSVSCVRAGEPISPPAPELLRFMRNADQMFIFPNPTPRKPRRDDKHMRLLPRDARRTLIDLIGDRKDWYDGWDNRIDPGGPPPKDINLLFRRGRDELILFFYPGQVIEARFNGRRQPLRWSFAFGSYEGMERWKARHARPELATQ